MPQKQLTIVFTVGGDNHHYENMFRCMKSFERLSFVPECLVLEFGTVLKSCKEYEVINLPDAVDFSSNKKVGYIIWRHKYVGALMVQTKYGAYIDTDTVIAQDNFVNLIENLQGGISVTKHFWVPTVGNYKNKAVSKERINDFEETRAKIGLNYEDSFYAGGFFLFENNDNTRKIFERTLELNDEFYKTKDGYVKSITDELFFSAALKENKSLVREVGGGFNHCTMGDNHMPMILYNDQIYGKNPYEIFWTKVTILHCDVGRRNPAENYEGILKEKIKNFFYL